jgi:glyoxylase I family protein
MMKLGIMMIFVTDLEVAKEFYCGVLGFPLLSEDAHRLEFEHSGCRFVAFKCASDASIDRYSDVARSVFLFEVPSIDESVREMRSKGVRFLHAQPAENEFSRYAAFVDPFGNVHEVYEPNKK